MRLALSTNHKEKKMRWLMNSVPRRCCVKFLIMAALHFLHTLMQRKVSFMRCSGTKVATLPSRVNRWNGLSIPRHYMVFMFVQSKVQTGLTEYCQIRDIVGMAEHYLFFTFQMLMGCVQMENIVELAEKKLVQPPQK